MNHPKHDGTRADGLGLLAGHAKECEECSAQPLPLQPLAALLDAVQVQVDAATLSRRTLARLGPELGRFAQAASWRRVWVGVLLALLPLPAVVAYDAYFLRVVYAVVSVLLPAAFAAYLVLSYAAFLVLLFALTYAAIPLLVVRDGRRLPTLS